MKSVSDVSIEFVDRPDLPWAYADSITSVWLESKAVCKVELSTVRWSSHEAEVNASGKQYPVCRIAMSLRAMVDLHKRLTRLLSQLEGEEAVNRARQR